MIELSGMKPEWDAWVPLCSSECPRWIEQYVKKTATQGCQPTAIGEVCKAAVRRLGWYAEKLEGSLSSLHDICSEAARETSLHYHQTGACGAFGVCEYCTSKNTALVQEQSDEN